jgi:hypothetical protein
MIRHRNEAMNPMKMPAKESEHEDGATIGKRVQTWGKELVFVKQRVVAIRFGGARVGVVALEFHVDGVGIGILGLVDDGIGFGELSRRGDIKKSILGRRRNAVDDVGNESI